jgi:hypothetical protein
MLRICRSVIASVMHSLLMMLPEGAPESCGRAFAKRRALLGGKAPEFDEAMSGRDLCHRQSRTCRTKF